MNLYMRASEELAVLLARSEWFHFDRDDDAIKTAHEQMNTCYMMFKEAFHKAAHMFPIFHPSQATISPGIVYPHGVGRSQDVVVWSEPRWTVEH
jgi:hypothetical protein